MKTPDGTILTSWSRHDFVQHTDKNGKTYFVDGGREYLRRGGDYQDCEEMSKYLSDNHEENREYFTWGSYGKDGKDRLHYIKLCDMTDEHIITILETQEHIKDTYVEDLFNTELEYRHKDDGKKPTD